MENQRNAFIEFAKKNNFDPLVAQNWYSVSPEAFIQHVVRISHFQDSHAYNKIGVENIFRILFGNAACVTEPFPEYRP